MTFVRLGWLVGVALLVMALNVAISILYMVVYSYLIDPGHDETYYNDHIAVAAPYCSIVAGIPLMFAAGWWVAGWWEGKSGSWSALIVWLIYAIIDLSVLMAVGITTTVAVLVAISLATKLAAAYLGAVLRSGRVRSA